MPWLSEKQRNRAFRMVQAGMAHNTVARHFGVHQNTIQSLWRRFQQSGNTKEWQRSMRHHMTSLRQDNHNRLAHLRNHFQSARLTARCIPGLQPISPWTVRNRLRRYNIWPRRPAVRPMLVQRHRTAILACCRWHLRVRIQDWTNILLTNESSFICVAVTAVIECIVALMNGTRTPMAYNVNEFGGGSFVLWGGIAARGRTPVQSVNGNLIGVRYLDEIIRCHVVPFIQRQQNHITLQQDDASPHVARVVRDCFCAKECWCLALSSCFRRNMGDRLGLGCNGTTPTPFTKSAGDVG
jgi:transposase